MRLCLIRKGPRFGDERSRGSVSFGFHGSQQVPTRGPILIFRKVPYLEACAALEQIDAGNAQDIREIFHCLALAIRAVCPRVRHSEDTSKANPGLQTMRHEIPRIDAQLPQKVCFDPDAVLAALAKSKVACATSLASLPLPSSEKCPFRPMRRVGRARALACLRLRRRARRRTLRLRRRP